MQRAYAVSILLAAARVAHADGTGVIARGDPATAAAMAAAIGDGAHADAVAEARAAIAAGAVPVAQLARFRAVRDAVALGWRAYLQVQPELAASRLADARTDAEQLLAIAGGSETYADASLRLGAVLANLGRADEARAALRLALALDPTRPITNAEFSPDITAAIDAARAATVPLRRVHLGASARGALIAVDGIERGPAPVELDLEVGQHVVVARAPGLVAGLAIAVDDSHTSFAIELEAALAGDAERVDAGPVAGAHERTAAFVETVAGYAELDAIVLANATVAHGGPALVVQRCAGAPLRCTTSVEIGYAAGGLAAAAKSAWDAVKAGPLREAPVVFDGGGTGGVVDHPCKLCRNPWVWGGAALVVGAVVGAIIYATHDESRPPPIVGVDPGAFHN